MATTTTRLLDATGRYSLGSQTAVLNAGLAANVVLWGMKWASSTVQAKVLRITLDACVAGAFFVAPPATSLELGLFRVYGWSGSMSTGTSLTPGTQWKRNTNMNSSVLAAGDCRWAPAAGITTGAQTTVEANPMAQACAGPPITGSLSPQIIAPGTVLFDGTLDDDDAITLGFQDGIEIKTVVAAPATGVWIMGLTVYWAEIPGPSST
jgi:hypothetical protein